jgi:hypothetical protein
MQGENCLGGGGKNPNSLNTRYKHCGVGRAWSWVFIEVEASLDKEFKYVDNELFVVGFRNVVKRSLKT